MIIHDNIGRLFLKLGYFLVPGADDAEGVSVRSDRSQAARYVRPADCKLDCIFDCKAYQFRSCVSRPRLALAELSNFASRQSIMDQARNNLSCRVIDTKNEVNEESNKRYTVNRGDVRCFVLCTPVVTVWIALLVSENRAIQAWQLRRPTFDNKQ